MKNKHADVKEKSSGDTLRKGVAIALVTATIGTTILPVLYSTIVLGAENDEIMLISEGGDGTEIDVIDEKWGKPTYVIGGGLNEQEADETLKLLGIKDSSSVLTQTINGDELIRYLGGGTGDTSSMLSSVLVQKQDKVKGVEVEIVTPENITTITPLQYQKAALNLGVEGVSLKVASIKPVTGESALSGVYKALEVNGEEFSEGQMAVSNAETETFAQVAAANKENEDYNPDDVTLMLTELEQELKEVKDKQDQALTEQEIKDLIDAKLKEKDINFEMSDANIASMAKTLDMYQNTPEIIDSAAIAKNTKAFTKDVDKQLSKGLNYLEDKLSGVDKEALKAEGAGIFSKIASWFKNVFGGLFSKTEEVAEDKTSEVEADVESEPVDSSTVSSEEDVKEVEEPQVDATSEVEPDVEIDEKQTQDSSLDVEVSSEPVSSETDSSEVQDGTRTDSSDEVIDSSNSSSVVK